MAECLVMATQDLSTKEVTCNRVITDVVVLGPTG